VLKCTRRRLTVLTAAIAFARATLAIAASDTVLIAKGITRLTTMVAPAEL
jgi:hypothetical protein